MHVAEPAMRQMPVRGFWLETTLKPSRRIPMMSNAPTASHLFIVKPLTGRSLAGLFSTHPPIPERIRSLLGR